ncbi:MAG: Gfo/Idh/MocA family oxidoreductase [Kiritimatiellaeota bacterium]|nr:Gfo/Idh/MocA family oxidoreductase [Kiritimatiellota bacterium]
MITSAMDRREFLKTAGLAVAAVTLPGLRAWAAEPAAVNPKRFCDPGRKMRIACVGCGGKGASDIDGVASEEIVALCDVSRNPLASQAQRFPNAKQYKDYRQMLKDLGDQIDAVTVSTPDHMHFPVAFMAMNMGKHVFVQKPLTHTVWEARTLTELAHTQGLVTVMGNQGHAGDGTRRLKEMVMAGAVGPIREVLFWPNRPNWPQGIERPAGEMPVPSFLDWNRWLGVAPERPYHKCYQPFNWRGWWDFGTGALGDMGCHIMDAAFWALDLKYPVSVEAESGGGTDESGPKWSVITYQFPARGALPPVKVTWSDGGRKPAKPRDMAAMGGMPDGGQLLIGENGSIFDGSDYCESPRILPEEKQKAFQPPPATLPRVPGGPGGHYQEWIKACKGQGPLPGSNFDHAGPLTEMVVMGNLAVRLGKKVEWDGPNVRCTNLPEAEPLLRKAYRFF